MDSLGVHNLVPAHPGEQSVNDLLVLSERGRALRLGAGVPLMTPKEGENLHLRRSEANRTRGRLADAAHACRAAWRGARWSVPRVQRRPRAARFPRSGVFGVVAPGGCPGACVLLGHRFVLSHGSFRRLPHPTATRWGPSPVFNIVEDASDRPESRKYAGGGAMPIAHFKQ